MDEVERIKEDVRQGRISAERLIEVVGALQRELEAARRRIAELEKQSGGSATAKVNEPFSMRAEEQRQESRGKIKRRKQQSKRRGRVTTAEKIRRAERTEKVFPAGVPGRT